MHPKENQEHKIGIMIDGEFHEIAIEPCTLPTPETVFTEISERIDDVEVSIEEYEIKAVFAANTVRSFYRVIRGILQSEMSNNWLKMHGFPMRRRL